MVMQQTHLRPALTVAGFEAVRKRALKMSRIQLLCRPLRFDHQRRHGCRVTLPTIPAIDFTRTGSRGVRQGQKRPDNKSQTNLVHKRDAQRGSLPHTCRRSAAHSASIAAVVSRCDADSPCRARRGWILGYRSCWRTRTILLSCDGLRWILTAAKRLTVSCSTCSWVATKVEIGWEAGIRAENGERSEPVEA